MHGDVPHAAPAVVATPLKFEPLATSYESHKRPSRLASRVPGMGMVSPVPVQTSAGVCPVAAAQRHSVKSAPRDVPQVCPTRSFVRRRSARKDSVADCGLSQLSVALRRQPQRTVWLRRGS
jgi:hypothetical protein